MYDYIIIGAGISGIYMAHLLHKDFNILVLDKNNYIGGRLKEYNLYGTPV